MQSIPFSESTYIHRRKILKESIGSGQILLLGNKESSINFKDNWYPFRQDSTFLYYAGVALPGLFLLIDIDKDSMTLFGDDLSIDDIVWTGPQPTLTELAAKVGIEKVLPLARLQGQLGKEVHYLPPYRPEHQLQLAEWMNLDHAAINAQASVKLIKAIAAQREIKSSEEIIEIEHAVSITAGMHRKVIESARPGMKEHELVGIAREYLWQQNAASSFPTILTINGQILHNHDHSHEVREGDMVLHDGGAEIASGYAGDMTRTFPVGKTFRSRQAELYEVVLQAMNAAVAALRPGVLFRDVHLLACRQLVDGLKAIGLMKGNTDAAVDAGAHTMFFQCGLGHMMGLDVHDMENLGEPYIGYTDQLIKSTEFGLKSLRLGKALKEGFVLTIEPGVYIIPQLIDLFKSQNKFTDFIHYDRLESYRDFGGIRIEDDFVITAQGAQLLGKPLGKSITEVEELRRSAY